MSRAGLLLSVALLAGCTSEPVVRSGKNVQIERMDNLGVVEEGYWLNEETKDIISGNGSSGQWQQGMARMSQPDFDRLVADLQWQPFSTEPIIPVELRGKLDTGDSWLLGQDAGDVYYVETDTRVVLFMVWD